MPPLHPVNDEPEVTPVFYCNSVNLTMTVYDMTLLFALAQGPEPEDQMEVVKVVMSPQHAKTLARMMEDYLENYESEIGPIALPSEMGPQGPKKGPKKL